MKKKLPAKKKNIVEKPKANSEIQQSTQLAEKVVYEAKDQSRIDACIQRYKNKPSPPRLKLNEPYLGGNKVSFSGDGDGALFEIAFRDSLGTTSGEAATFLFNQLTNALPAQSVPITNNLNSSLAILNGIAPKDELEGMLAVQMVSVHNLSMEFMRRAMSKDQTNDGVTANVERFTKLQRTFTAQMEALNRYRGKGQQKVTVEHINVHEGGKAIVGNVNHSNGGGDKV